MGSELKAFDDTKAGVKGLVDAGIAKIPRIFVEPATDDTGILPVSEGTPKVHAPVIDLTGIHDDPVRRKEIIQEVGDASEKWGFFQVVNHGIPLDVLEDMLTGVRNFHEQDFDEKKMWYTRKPISWRKLVYNCNFNLYRSSTTNWRDTFNVPVAPSLPKPEELPEICRDILLQFIKEVQKLGCSVLELLSEALGLPKERLIELGCGEGLNILGHYYPGCPEPELTLGTSRHSDPTFITVLLQDLTGGLQFVHNNQWFDVPPCPGALLVNIGDLLQLITNDRFISAEHRVIAKHVGPRISVACIFYTGLNPTLKRYQPIQELLSDDNPPKYGKTTVKDYLLCCQMNNIFGKDALSYFKI
nr:PREDICTED: 1-aminocyclopropane-1-carboxylate oxidase homolog 1-like isoform X2 [Daucus carota subsp. sativus]